MNRAFFYILFACSSLFACQEHTPTSTTQKPSTPTTPDKNTVTPSSSPLKEALSIPLPFLSSNNIARRPLTRQAYNDYYAEKAFYDLSAFLPTPPPILSFLTQDNDYFFDRVSLLGRVDLHPNFITTLLEDDTELYLFVHKPDGYFVSAVPLAFAQSEGPKAHMIYSKIDTNNIIQLTIMHSAPDSIAEDILQLRLDDNGQFQRVTLGHTLELLQDTSL